MSATPTPTHFIRQIIENDLATGKHTTVTTRFPPEPNGYLHIGHAKSICLNFGVARDFGGQCHLRMDDTNPTKEDEEFVTAIQNDVRWLGFSWDRLAHASDYFQALYDFAEQLIQQGKAYVESLTAEEMRQHRGTLTEPGRESPYRNRSVAENLELFRRMRAGEFPDGAHVLRAKIDMQHPNINLRDPPIYRIRHATHQQTGDAWCIYPLYDYTHCLSDALEGITHSLCTLEFEDHRPLYDWVLDQLPVPCHPQQIEFSRLNLDYTVLSKRKLTQLVAEGHVTGWDDPRMMTIAGIRRRGYPPEAIRDFCSRIGITKKETVIEMSLLENCVREELDRTAPRVMAILKPLKLVLLNYPEDGVPDIELPNHPQRPELGRRTVPFGRELWIEQDDFMEQPVKGFHRLAPGKEVRLRGAYIICCESVQKTADGQIAEIHCTLDLATRSGSGPQAERKVKGTIHWVAARSAVDLTVRLYDRLFRVPFPDDEPGSFLDYLNADSVDCLADAKGEPQLATLPPETRVQFERLGYFTADRWDHRADQPTFNRTISLRDSWDKPK